MCCDDKKTEFGDFEINSAFATEPNLGVPGTWVRQKLLLNGLYKITLKFMSFCPSNTIVSGGLSPIYFFSSPQINNPADGSNYFGAFSPNGILLLSNEYNYVFEAYLQGYLDYNIGVGDVYNTLFPQRSPAILSSRNNLRVSNDYFTSSTGAGVNTFLQVLCHYERIS